MHKQTSGWTSTTTPDICAEEWRNMVIRQRVELIVTKTPLQYWRDKVANVQSENVCK